MRLCASQPRARERMRSARAIAIALAARAECSRGVKTERRGAPSGGMRTPCGSGMSNVGTDVECAEQGCAEAGARARAVVGASRANATWRIAACLPQARPPTPRSPPARPPRQRLAATLTRLRVRCAGCVHRQPP